MQSNNRPGSLQRRIYREFPARRFEVSALLETETFRIRPITVHDLVKDYEAVMTNRKHLWELFGEAWGWHQKEFQLRSSFDYAVVSLDERRMLGCIYVDPPEKEGFDAEVYFWALADIPNTDLEKDLAEVVRRWISLEWPFGKVAYPGRNMTWEEYNALPDRRASR